MKKKIFRVISCIMVIAITASLVMYSSKRVERKESIMKYDAFLEEKQNYDILFLGTSHMVNGVYPMELWNEYGYTSYNLANHSTPLPVSYWVLMNALDYTTPKLVVLDCFGWDGESKLSEEVAYTHKALDAFPFSLTKYKAAKDITADSDDIDAFELLFDFSIYHNRWDQLTEYDYEVKCNNQRGAERRIDVATPVEYYMIDPSITYDEETLGKKYVEKIIEECQARGIEVLLTWIPYPPFRESAQAQSHSVAIFAEENNVNYINFLDMNVVNYNTDLYDSDAHLNPSGAMKVTNYLGDFIKENYDVTNHMNEEGYDSWRNDMEEYRLEKKSGLIFETNPVIYMMLLNDDDFDVKLDWNYTDITDDDRYSSLLGNLGVSIENVEAFSANYISGKDVERTVSYEESNIVFDENYNLSITVYDAESGEQFDNVWVYYSPGEETTITHIYY